MKRVRIIADCDPCNPRTDWDCHVGRMICWHSRYILGDDHTYIQEEFLRILAFEACEGLEDKVYHLENDVFNRLCDWKGFERTEELINAKVAKLIEKAVCNGYVILPLHLYDHSGITMSTGQFRCPWDSGQVGWIVCDDETIQREFDGDRDKAEKVLEIEVAIYDDYLTGNVYGFIVEETNEFDEDGEPVWDGCNELDSCWGFYGDDVHTNGIAENLDADLVDLAASADIEYPSY